MSLSVSMIVRNSADVLERCLESVKDADEIVICDTGSSDNTIEIAKKYTDKVYSYYGCNKPGTADGLFMDFADARNKSLSYCTSTHILTIDADEVLETPIKKLRDFKGESLSVECINDASGEAHRQPRLYINHPKVFWKGAAHNYLTCGNGELSDVTIRYYSNKQKEADPDRTKRILEHWIKKHPKDCTRELYYLAKEYHKRGQYFKTIRTLRKYLKRSSFTVEKADAFLLMSRCYVGIRKHKEAINACMAAINLNPDFPEALRLAGDLSGDINRLKYQYLASKATNHGVLFARQNNRIKVTMLSDYDWAGSGARIVKEVRKASKGNIDIEAIVYYPGQGSSHWAMQTGVPVHVIGADVAQERVNNSDIIHYKDDYPYQRQFHELIVPDDKKIARLVSGSIFREKAIRTNDLPIEDYQCDYNAYISKDLHVDGWHFMPNPYNRFEYKWKRANKFRIVHVPSDPAKKGTQMIADAINLLDRKDIEFVCVANITHQQSLNLKGTASLYIDQMLLPPVGNSAYEAMGFGIPVISWTGETDDIVLSPDKQTAESLAATIEAVLNWDILEGLSLAAFKDVKERCGDMGTKWMNVYKELMKSLITKS